MFSQPFALFGQGLYSLPAVLIPADCKPVMLASPLGIPQTWMLYHVKS